MAELFRQGNRGFYNLALTDTNDTFLKEECYKKIALIQKDIKEGEYPWYVAPFNKIDHASLLLTNIHILELDYLNQNTVKAVNNMLRNNFKDIYNPEIYIIANYEEPIIKNYTIIDKIAKGKVITFEDLNIKYVDHTDEELQYIGDIVNDIRKLDSELVADIQISSNLFINFVDFLITQCTIIFMAAYFEELHNFHQNLDNLNFLVPLQKYIPECQPRDYKSFVKLKAITWNRFLVKYQKLFENIQNILFSICSDSENFVKLLISDSYHLSLNKRIEIIEYLIDKYKNDTKSIYYITQQLFDICDDNTDIKTIEAKAKQFYKYIEYFRSWDDLPSYWYMDFKGLPRCDKEALIMSNSVKPENDYIELEKL